MDVEAHEGPPFRISIVAHDSMSSDLLANPLVRDGGYDAAAIQAVDLIPSLSIRKIDHVIMAPN